jgi:uridine kinase
VDDKHKIIEVTRELLKKKQPVLVAIGGYGGSGKTTLARAIQNQFPNSTIITLDDFAVPDGGSDRKRIISQVLLPLSEQRLARYQRFVWQQQSFMDWRELKPEGLIIVEGVSVLEEDFNSYYDFRIWIDCPLELASERGMARDRILYGSSYDRMWEEFWKKEDRDYGKTEPWKRADLVILYSELRSLQ